MKTALCAAAFAAAALTVLSAYADELTGVTGAVGGAVVGGVVAGPPGAIVGAGIGALMGSSLAPRPSVAYQQPIVVGQALPGDYTYYEVPNQPDYEYVVLNNQRVIVTRNDHRIVRVIDR